VSQIPFVDLKAQYRRLKPEIDARIRAVLEHGQYILGPEVDELERQLAAFAGTPDAVAVSSGTDALLMALMALGVGEGDAVFLPSFTFPATAEVVVLLGATPVFADVNPDTFNLDPEELREQVEAVTREGRLRPRAIIPVDLFGLPADYPAIGKIATDFGLSIVADAAQSFGGSLGQTRVGALAPLTATSFFPAKPLGCYGDGGAIFSTSGPLAEVLRSIRAHGKGSDRYDIVRVGLNGRLDTLQAAILLPKLAILAQEIEAREALSRLYDRRLADFVQLPGRVDGSQSAWAQYSILVDDRDGVVHELQAQGIPFAIYYPKPIHLQSPYARFSRGEGSLPITERLSRNILSIPMHPYVEPELAERICSAVIRALREAHG
jgi:dTDP-4-amino-4,6-dideoxygalactose transaminase